MRPFGASGQVARVEDGIGSFGGDVCECDEDAHVGVAASVLGDQGYGRRRIFVIVAEHEGDADDGFDVEFIGGFGELERAGDVVAVNEGERVVPQLFGASEHFICG